MKQPFTHSIETQILDPNHLYLAVQTRRTFDADDLDGVVVDDTLYRHIHVDLETGDLFETYVAPLSV